MSETKRFMPIIEKSENVLEVVMAEAAIGNWVRYEDLKSTRILLSRAQKALLKRGTSSSIIRDIEEFLHPRKTSNARGESV